MKRVVRLPGFRELRRQPNPGRVFHLPGGFCLTRSRHPFWPTREHVLAKVFLSAPDRRNRRSGFERGAERARRHWWLRLARRGKQRPLGPRPDLNLPTTLLGILASSHIRSAKR